jgi:hypothetical protein
MLSSIDRSVDRIPSVSSETDAPWTTARASWRGRAVTRARHRPSSRHVTRWGRTAARVATFIHIALT